MELSLSFRSDTGAGDSDSPMVVFKRRVTFGEEVKKPT